MASSGNFSTNDYSGRNLIFSWSISSQSIADNKTTIYWELKGGGYQTQWYNAGNFKVVIDGETVYSNATRIRLLNGTLVAYGYKDIAHNTDGTRAFSASAEAGIYAIPVNCTGSDSWELTSIPRAASITSATDFDNVSVNPTITYNNSAGNAVDSLEAYIYSADDKVAYIGGKALGKTDTSYTFTLSEAEKNVLLNATPNSNTMTVNFYIKTVIKGVDYWSSPVQKTFWVGEAHPTLNPTIKDTGGYSTPLTGNNQRVIKSFNYMNYSIGAAAIKGATLVSQSITCGGKSSTEPTGGLDNVESGTFVFTATDSRGNTTTTTIELELIEYINLTCNLNVEPPTTDGVMHIDISGNYYTGSFGTTNNSLAVQYRFKVNDSEYTEWINTNPTITNNTYKVEIVKEDVDYLNTYTVQARAIDKIYPNKESVVRVVKTTPVFDWGKEDFSINVHTDLRDNVTFHKDTNFNGTNTVNGIVGFNNNVEFNGANTIFNSAVGFNGGFKVAGFDLDYIREQGSSGYWFYRKWNSGFCELWGWCEPTYGASHYLGIYQAFPVTLTTWYSATGTINGYSGNLGSYLNTNVKVECFSYGCNVWVQNSHNNYTSTDKTSVSLYIVGRWK